MKIFLAPHLDDAVLSCGGQLASEADRGKRPRVITLFAGVPRAPHQAAARYVARRRAEDHAAHLALGEGVEVRHLDFLDALYRVGRAGESSYAPGDVLGEVSAGDRGLVPRLVRALLPSLPSPSRCELYAPLAIGHHVDHQLVYRVSRALARRGYRVKHYEDVPYTFHPAARLEVLRRRIGWSGEEHLFDEHSLRRKLRAIACYRSQLKPLFGSKRALRRSLGDYSRDAGGSGHYAERVWFAPPRAGRRAKASRTVKR